MILWGVVDGEDEMVGEVIFANEIERERFGHFAHDNAGFIGAVWAGQNLARAEAFGSGLMMFNVGNVDAFVAPGVVNEELSIDAKKLVE